jgi:hypothetical protein
MKNEPHVQNADMMNLLVQCWGQAEVPKYRPRGHESYTSLNGDSPTKLPDILHNHASSSKNYSLTKKQ